MLDFELTSLHAQAPRAAEGALLQAAEPVGRTPWSAADAVVGLCGPVQEESRRSRLGGRAAAFASNVGEY